MRNKLNKIKELINKYDNIFIIILIILSIFGITLNILIENSDELWNFQSIYKMYNGFQIYKDFNVIITPLFFIIGKILFNIFGANFLTFRIYNIIIMTILYFIIYILLKKLEINKKISTIIILILIILKDYLIIRCQANYNTMALMLCILGIYFCIKKYKNNSILQGIIVFLIFCTKQNICVYYGTSLFLFEILSKDTVKNKIKNLLIELIIFIFSIIILLFIFYKNNILYDFVNYTFLGIKEFGNKNISIDIKNIIMIISLIIINLIFSYLFIKNKKIKLNKNEKENIITLNCFAIPLSLACWPIVNDIHTLIGIYVLIILLIYLINIMINKINLKIKKQIINLIGIILCFFTCGFSIYNFYGWKINVNKLNKNYDIDKNNAYYGGIMEEKTIKNINNMVKYINEKNNNVIVLSPKSALYMIPLKQNNGMLDLPFKGNLGKDGEKGLIEKIKEINNAEILIEKDEEKMIWQESKIVRDYIVNNMKKVGEIEEFEIWRKM